MNKKEVIEFFDALAESWDAGMIKNEEVIQKILDNAGVSEGKTILDVACGTGVMIPYYLERQASKVVAIDISPKMCEIAGRKFPQKNVTIVCDDVMEHEFEERFDCIVIYNAFAHFDDHEKLITKLSGLLKENGILSVAHGMSREKIIAHHENVSHVSSLLPEAEQLQEIFSRYLDNGVKISDETMYLVTGTKRSK